MRQIVKTNQNLRLRSRTLCIKRLNKKISTFRTDQVKRSTSRLLTRLFRNRKQISKLWSSVSKFWQTINSQKLNLSQSSFPIWLVDQTTRLLFQRSSVESINPLIRAQSGQRNSLRVLHQLLFISIRESMRRKLCLKLYLEVIISTTILPHWARTQSCHRVTTLQVQDTH